MKLLLLRTTKSELVDLWSWKPNQYSKPNSTAAISLNSIGQTFKDFYTF